MSARQICEVGGRRDRWVLTGQRGPQLCGIGQCVAPLEPDTQITHSVRLLVLTTCLEIATVAPELLVTIDGVIESMTIWANRSGCEVASSAGAAAAGAADTTAAGAADNIVSTATATTVQKRAHHARADEVQPSPAAGRRGRLRRRREGAAGGGSFRRWLRAAAALS